MKILLFFVSNVLMSNSVILSTDLGKKLIIYYKIGIFRNCLKLWD